MEKAADNRDLGLFGSLLLADGGLGLLGVLSRHNLAQDAFLRQPVPYLPRTRIRVCLQQNNNPECSSNPAAMLATPIDHRVVQS